MVSNALCGNMAQCASIALQRPNIHPIPNNSAYLFGNVSHGRSRADEAHAGSLARSATEGQREGDNMADGLGRERTGMMTRREFSKGACAFIGAATAGAAGLLTAGCSGNDSASDDKAAASRDTLTIYVGEEPADGFDPLTGWGYNGSYILFQSRLLAFDGDLNLKGDLATGYEVSDDGLIYTYTLRDDAKFSDGTPVTARDVAFTYETAATGGTSTIDFTAIDAVAALDDRTVEFRLRRRDSSFPARTGMLGVVPEALYDAQSYRENPVGSGPFRLLQWDKGQQVIIEPNEYYYGTKSPFRQITIVFLDGEAALANAQSGQYDVVMVQPEYAKSQVNGMTLQTYETLDTRGFNLPTTPLATDEAGRQYGCDVTADRAIREALCIGVSRRAIIDGALNGIGTPSTALINHVAWSNPACSYEDGRVDEARRILDEAGWAEGPDGIREKDGLRAEFTVTGRTDDLQRYNLAQAFSQEAAKLGIKVNAESAQWQKCKDQAGAIPTCWGTGNYDPSGDLASYYASDGSYNFSHYRNDATDAHVAAALEATDYAAAIESWKQVQWDGEQGPESDKGDFAYIWLAAIDHTYFVRDGLNLGEQLVHPHGHGWPIVANLNEWHWDA